jgi:hypothetical protein
MKYLKTILFVVCVFIIVSGMIFIFIGLNKQYDKASSVCQSYGKKLQTIQIAGHEIIFMCIDNNGDTILVK